MSTLFSSANVASSGSGLLYFMGYVPYFFVMNSYDSFSSSAKMQMSLLSPTAIGMGANILSKFEISGVGCVLPLHACFAMSMSQPYLGA